MFLKKLAALRKESQEGKKAKETEFIKDLFISVGAKYLSDLDKATKVSTLLKHVFSPTDGRATLPAELTDCILEGKAEYYWYAFEYLIENIDWYSCAEKIDDIVINIVKDEKLNIKNRFLDENKRNFNVMDSDIFRKLDFESRKRFVSDFFLDYFYYLVRWDRLVTSKFGGNFIEPSSYHPDIFTMFEMHDHNNMEKKYSGYLDIKSKRLYLPKEDVYVKYCYDLFENKLCVEIAQNDAGFYVVSKNNEYCSYVNKNYLLLWNLNNTEGESCHYKIIKNHEMNISTNSFVSIHFNNTNDKIFINTTNSTFYVSVNEFKHVETAFKLGDNDVIIDKVKHIFIRDNVIYKINLDGEHEKVIDFSEVDKKFSSITVIPNKVKISDNSNYFIVECIDTSVWIFNKSQSKSIIDKPEIAANLDEQTIVNLIPQSRHFPTVLKCMFSESEKYALILWINNKENHYYISIVALEEMSDEKSVIEEKIVLKNDLKIEYSIDEIKPKLTQIGTSGDEFIIPFEIETKDVRYNYIINSVIHDGEIVLSKHKYICS